MLRIFVGFDQREAVAYHTFCQSVIDRTSIPVAFTPLASHMFEGVGTDGTNAFTLTRFLVPYLCDFTGWAIYADSDMVAAADFLGLWEERYRFIFDKAAAVVKHDYQTKHPIKYIGTQMMNANADYERKNWSSLILWNCAHSANRCLTPDFIREHGGKFLHRFRWLMDRQVGALDQSWNHLVGEYEPTAAKLYHYTLGIPALNHYANAAESEHWHRAHTRSLEHP